MCVAERVSIPCIGHTSVRNGCIRDIHCVCVCVQANTQQLCFSERTVRVNETSGETMLGIDVNLTIMCVNFVSRSV